MRTKLLLVVMTILVFILVAMLVCGGRERFKLHSHLLSDLRRPKKRSVTVAVGIPCIPIHLAFLPTVLETIRSQTRRPDEILVALSSYDGPDGTPEELENAGIEDLNIRFLNTRAQCYSGHNRNRIAAATTCDVISFMDADDTMESRRIELVAQAFEEYDIEMFLHGYRMSDD